jgi:hypothetical protein
MATRSGRLDAEYSRLHTFRSRYSRCVSSCFAIKSLMFTVASIGDGGTGVADDVTTKDGGATIAGAVAASPLAKRGRLVPAPDASVAAVAAGTVSATFRRTAVGDGGSVLGRIAGGSSGGVGSDAVVDGADTTATPTHTYSERPRETAT